MAGLESLYFLSCPTVMALADIANWFDTTGWIVNSEIIFNRPTKERSQCFQPQICRSGRACLARTNETAS